jgi:Methyltransferase FkbM domain
MSQRSLARRALAEFRGHSDFGSEAWREVKRLRKLPLTERRPGRFRDVTVVDKAVWFPKGILSFASEGGDVGRLGEDSTEVTATRLRDWLTEPIDLLKLDIEGAEVEVTRTAPTQCRASPASRWSTTRFGKPQRLGATLEVPHEAGFRVWIRHEWVPAHRLLSEEHRVGIDMRLNIFARR